MTQDQFYTWLNNPDSMNSESIPQLREVIKRYPYFTAAQILLVKNLRSENHIDQLKQLQLAAIMAPDRKVLHDYLNDKKKPNSQVKAVPEQKRGVAIEESNAEVEQPIQKAEEPDTVEVTQKEPDVEETITEQPETIESGNQEPTEPRFPDELIPEPVVYQLETAYLPELPQKEKEGSEPHERSFSEWLSFAESAKLDTKETSTQAVEQKQEEKTEKRSTIDLIDHFLTQADSVPKKKAEFFNPRKVAAKGDAGDFRIVSETLADIYFKQEKFEMAKQAYEALKLKYPEKSAYFAARLKEIEDKLTSE